MNNYSSTLENMEPNSGAMCIDDLNDDCLYSIFDYLTLPDRWIAAKVCERWRTIHDTTLFTARALDTSNPSWAYIFNENNDENLKIAENIFSQYGKFIKRFNCHRNKAFRFDQRFPMNIALEYCSPTQLQCVSLSRSVQFAQILELSYRFHNIIEFRMNCDTDFCYPPLRTLICRNKKFKSVQMTISHQGRSCVSRLKDKPIEKLVISIESQDTLDRLTAVLKTLRAVKTLGIKYNGRGHVPLDASSLMEVFSEATQLIKLQIQIPGIANYLIRSSSCLRDLVELNIQFEDTVTDEFLSHLGDQLMNLKSLNVTGCQKINDQGLMTLSKLKKLKELYIEELNNINGRGLMHFVKLKRLSCGGSTIFDGAILHVLNSCEKLEFLNIIQCTNTSLACLDTAIRITTNRGNRIVLKMLLDLKLIQKNRIQIPPLLQLFYSKNTSLMSVSWRSYKSDYLMSNRNIGTGCYELERSTIFMDSLYVNYFDIPNLKDSCLSNVMSFIPVIKRIQMKLVSTRWNKLILTSWRRLEKLDTTTTEWKFVLFQKSYRRIVFIMNRVLKECGKHLQCLVLDVLNGLDSVFQRCPNLRKIVFHQVRVNLIHSTLLANFYSELTELRMDITLVGDRELSSIFKSNQNLKTLILEGNFDMNFDSFMDLNHLALETLHLYGFNFKPPQDILQTSFFKTLASFTNLKSLVVMPGLLVIKLIIQAIEGFKNLRALVLGSSVMTVETMIVYTPIYEMTELETLAFRSFKSATDQLLGQLSCYCVSLSYVDISGCTNVTDDGLKTISTLPKLHTLIMEDLPEIKGTGLSLLSGSTFCHLECQMCYSILTDPICDVISNCSRLKYLNIVYCSKLDQKVIDVALEATNRRTNGVRLKIISDSTLICVKRGINAPLLEVSMHENQSTFK